MTWKEILPLSIRGICREKIWGGGAKILMVCLEFFSPPLEFFTPTPTPTMICPSPNSIRSLGHCPLVLPPWERPCYQYNHTELCKFMVHMLTIKNRTISWWFRKGTVHFLWNCYNQGIMICICKGSNSNLLHHCMKKRN